MRTSRRGSSGSSQVDSPGYRTDVLEVLAKLLSDRTDVRPGKMFGFPAFFTCGKLFACVYGEGVGLKLPEDTVRRLVGKPGIIPFQPYGKPKVREWIHICHDRPGSFSKEAGLFKASIRFVAGATLGGGPRATKRPTSPASK